MEPVSPLLPPEVHGEIMKWHPELIRQSQLVNRGVARATTGYYLQQECLDKLVSRNEILDYLINVNPTNVGGCQVSAWNEIDTFAVGGQIMQSMYIKDEMVSSAATLLARTLERDRSMLLLDSQTVGYR